MVKTTIKIDVKNTEKVAKALKVKVKQFLIDGESMEKVNRVLQTELKRELESQGVQTQRISDMTVKRRERLSKTNKTSKYYAANKSNLHFSGQLVASIFSKFVKAGTFRLDFKEGRRKPYKDPKKKFTRIDFTKKKGKIKVSEKVPTNKEVGEGLIDNGWRLLFFPRKKAPSRIANLFRRYIRRNNKL